MRRQRLYWLAEIVEHRAERWRERGELYQRVAREAARSRDILSDEDFGEVLAFLQEHKRIERKPDKGRGEMIRRVAAPPARGEGG